MKKLLYLFVAAAVLSATACNGGGGENTIPAGEEVAVSMTLDIAPVSAGGEETADTRQSLNNVWILVFDKSGTNVMARKETRFEIGKPVETRLISGPGLSIFIVANLDAGTSFQLGKMSLTEFMAALNSTNLTGPESIPLSGAVNASIDKAGQAVGVTLSRIAAKLSFKFTFGGEGYTVKSMSVKNVPHYPYYVPQSGKTSWGPGDFKEVALALPFDQQYTIYTGENLMGTESGITSAKEKVTSKLAVCVEVVAEKAITDGRTVATFRFYPGENATTDFNVMRNSEYSYTETVDFSDESDKRITRVDKGLEREAVDANCYMIEPSSTYEVAIPVARVNKFWSSLDGGGLQDNMINDGANGGKVEQWKVRVIESTNEKNLIAFVKDSGSSAQETIILKAADTGEKGSVIIGIFDATDGEPASDAKPLWSWHIWVTDYVPGGLDEESEIPVVENNPGRTNVPGGSVALFGNVAGDLSKDGQTAAVMDRNLGALSANHEDGLATFGLFYQWGRKDPFIPKFDINDYDVNEDLPSVVAITNTITGQFPVSYTIQNPNKFILCETSAKGEWVNSEGYNTLWYNATTRQKTIYDPCPAGWRVPWTLSTLAGAEAASSLWSEGDGTLPVEQWGWYAFNETANCYFPMTGSVSGSTGKIGSIGINSPVWTGIATGAPHNAYITRFVWLEGLLSLPDQFEDGGITYNYMPPAEVKAGGKVVRCVKE